MKKKAVLIIVLCVAMLLGTFGQITNSRDVSAQIGSSKDDASPWYGESILSEEEIDAQLELQTFYGADELAQMDGDKYLDSRLYGTRGYASFHPGAFYKFTDLSLTTTTIKCPMSKYGAAAWLQDLNVPHGATIRYVDFSGYDYDPSRRINIQLYRSNQYKTEVYSYFALGSTNAYSGGKFYSGRNDLNIQVNNYWFDYTIRLFIPKYTPGKELAACQIVVGWELP